ncbi:cupin domain-containing protein [Phenylobacterium terrae]|uniref:Cupin domain-containing protein n=1 Tax=Phenylobacterium terrae TaxID=2665495 RepID=A0ABW4MXB3_9CAUL
MQTPQDNALWFLNTRVRFLRSSATGADGLSVQEHRLPFGDSPPLHVHEREDEIFHILEGTIRFKVGDDEVTAGPGQSLIGPKGVPHSFRVESPEGARMLVMSVGPDFEGLIRDVGRPAETDGLPEPMEPTPQMQADLARLAAARRIALIGPPMAA